MSEGPTRNTGETPHDKREQLRATVKELSDVAPHDTKLTDSISVPGFKNPSEAELAVAEEKLRKTGLLRSDIPSGRVADSSELNRPPARALGVAPQTNIADTLAERAGVADARRKMLKAEAAYLGAYRALHKEHGFLSRLAGRNSPERLARERVTQLHEEYQDAQLALREAINESVAQRAAKRFVSAPEDDLALAKKHQDFFTRNNAILATEEGALEQERARHGDDADTKVQRETRKLISRNTSSVDRMELIEDIHALTDKIESKEISQEEKEQFEIERAALRARFRKSNVIHDADDRRAIHARYNSMVSHHTIGRGERARIAAKERGLDEASHLTFRKAVRWMQQKTEAQEARYGKRVARARRVVAFAFLGTAAGTVVGAVAGIAAPIAALSAFGLRAGRGLVGATVASTPLGAAAGAAGGKGYRATVGKRREAALAKARTQDISSREELDAQTRAWKKGSKEAIERGARFWERASAALFAAGVSGAAAHEIMSAASVLDHAASATTGIEQATHSAAPIPHAPEGVATMPAEHTVTLAAPAPVEHVHSNSSLLPPVEHAAHAPAVHEAPIRPAQEATVPHTAGEHHLDARAAVAHIDRSDEGADALFGDLKHQLRELYPDPSKAPPEVQYILHTRLHDLSEEYGFAKAPSAARMLGQSSVMHAGDTLQYDPTSGHLVFNNHVLASDASGHIEKISQFSGSYHTDHAPSGAGHATEQVAPGATAHAEAAASAPQHAAETAGHHTANAPQHQPGVLYNQEGEIVRDSSGNPVHTGSWVAPTHHVTEAAAQVSPSPALIHHEIAKLLDPSELGNYAHTPAFAVLYHSPHVSPELHKELVNVVAQSGVGPESNETLAHFLERVNHTASQRGLDPTRVYSNAPHRIVVYGGDIDAQRLVAYEHLLKHPKDQALVPYQMSNGRMTVANYSFIQTAKDGPPLQSLRPMLDASGNPVPPIDISKFTQSK
ncbi:MAG: hypothetical protein B7X04_02080 [Parcubacteria group bacterium 21-54-25]|nr:MAG: hypothetical protein B7X04_02080 [Parcubacteria group bacterium 21-54-25]HQU07641.1 hypothetical protein [Candidatus Paceibacterota bacterium]